MSADSAAAHQAHYIKIWGILLVLLIISVVGPMAEIRIVTLITAFGIAGVKAYLVIRNFMHINVEPRYIAYLMGTCIALMLIFFFGVSPDVMKHSGHHWVNESAKNAHPPEIHPGEGHGAAAGHEAPAGHEAAATPADAPAGAAH